MNANDLEKYKDAFDYLIQHGITSLVDEYLDKVSDKTKTHVEFIRSLKLNEHSGAALFLTGSSSWGLFNSITPDSDLDLFFVLPPATEIKDISDYLPLEVFKRIKNNKGFENGIFDGELIKDLSGKMSLTVITHHSFINSLLAEHFRMKILMPEGFVLSEKNKTERKGPIKALGHYNFENERMILNMNFPNKKLSEFQFVEAWQMLFLPTFFHFGKMDSAVYSAVKNFNKGILSYDWTKILPFHPRLERLPVWIIKDWTQYLNISPIKIG